jgi:hypothetical protein
MRDECAVNRDEPQLFNAALREQEPIERISGHWFRLNGCKDVMLIDRDKFESAAGQDVRQEFATCRKFKLPQSPFDGDSPQTRDAYVKLGIWVGEHRRSVAGRSSVRSFTMLNTMLISSSNFILPAAAA